MDFSRTSLISHFLSWVKFLCGPVKLSTSCGFFPFSLCYVITGRSRSAPQEQLPDESHGRRDWAGVAVPGLNPRRSWACPPARSQIPGQLLPRQQLWPLRTGGLTSVPRCLLQEGPSPLQTACCPLAGDIVRPRSTPHLPPPFRRVSQDLVAAQGCTQ